MVGLEPTSFICKTNILPVKLHSHPLQPIGLEPIPIISKTTALPIKLGFISSRTNFRQHDHVTTQHPLRTMVSLPIKYKLYIKNIFLFYFSEINPGKCHPNQLQALDGQSVHKSKKVHRFVMINDYQLFHLHVTKFQITIRTMTIFKISQKLTLSNSL